MSPHAMTSLQQELADRENIATTRNSLEELANKLESSLKPTNSSAVTPSSGNAMQLRQLRAMLQQKKEEMAGASHSMPETEPPEENAKPTEPASATIGNSNQMQDRISALQDRLTAAENAQTTLSRQMANILSHRMREPEASQAETHLSALRTQIIRDTDSRLASLETTLKDRVKQCETRSADAINQMGTQVARISERLQEDQRAALTSMQQAVSSMHAERDEKLSEVFAKLERGLKDAQRHSQDAVDPLKSTVSSLARRLDAVDKKFEIHTSPPPPPAPTSDTPANPVGSSTPSAAPENRPPESGANLLYDNSTASPQTQHHPPRYDASHLDTRPGGIPRYAAPGIMPELACNPKLHERRMQDEMIRSARLSVQNTDIDPDMPSSSTFNGLLDKQRGKLPMMAASALALAVAGGGVLSMMRGKPQQTADTAARSDNSNDLLIDQTSSATTPLQNQNLSPDTIPTQSISAPTPTLSQTTDSVAVQVTRIEPLRPEPANTPASSNSNSGDIATSLYRQGVQHLADGEKILGAERLTSAANQGLAIAQYRLAKLYEKGEGVPRSISTARIWTNKAAQNGNVSAMHDLAVFYAQGDGGLQNYELAAEWFERAAEYGLVDSQYNLGVLYEKGQGIPRDLEKAAFWYLRAGLSGDADGARRAQELGQQANWLNMSSIESRARAFVAKNQDPVANGRSFRTSAAAPPPAPALIADAQRLLAELGYDPGPADGISGSRTRRAVQSFQVAYRMTPTGAVTPDLVIKLRTALIEAKR